MATGYVIERLTGHDMVQNVVVTIALAIGLSLLCRRVLVLPTVRAQLQAVCSQLVRTCVSPATLAQFLSLRAWITARFTSPRNVGDGMVCVSYVASGLQRLAIVPRARRALDPGTLGELRDARPSHGRIMFLHVDDLDVTQHIRQYTNVGGYVHARLVDVVPSDLADPGPWVLSAVFVDFSSARVDVSPGDVLTRTVQDLLAPST